MSLPASLIVSGCPRSRWALAVLAACLALPHPRSSAVAAPPAGAGSEAAPATAADDDALERKAEIMNSARWRRAIFELGEWLSSQAIYTPAQVRNLKADFNRRVEAMTPQELEYLLDDLDAKFKILETPEARDVRSWVGQYLSVMSDQKRAEMLRDVPNVVTMTAGQLQQEIESIERKRSAIQRQQSAFDQGRQQLVQQVQAARERTATAVGRQSGGVSYSPYRGGGGSNGKPPFSDVRGSGMTLYSGPFGAGVTMSVGNF